MSAQNTPGLALLDEYGQAVAARVAALVTSAGHGGKNTPLARAAIDREERARARIVQCVNAHDELVAALLFAQAKLAGRHGEQYECIADALAKAGVTP